MWSLMSEYSYRRVVLKAGEETLGAVCHHYNVGPMDLQLTLLSHSNQIEIIMATKLMLFFCAATNVSIHLYIM